MYEIFADMSIDIDRDFAAEHGVRYIPMEIVLGDEARTACEPESLEAMHNYYEQLRNKVPTRTSQINPHSYVEAFEPLVKDGRQILYIALSSGLSKTYESAQLAVAELKEEYGDEAVQIEIVDSLGATGGQGLLTEAACVNRKNGLALSENAAWLRAHAANVHYWFKVEDLMYLKRGGRISGTAAVLGTALNIKPILIVNGEGKLDNISKKRGSKLAMKYLVECYKEAISGDSIAHDYPDGMENTVYISCADCMADAEILKQLVLEVNPEAKVRIRALICWLSFILEFPRPAERLYNLCHE